METFLVKVLGSAGGTGVAVFAIWVIYKTVLTKRNGVSQSVPTPPTNTDPRLPILGGTNPVDEISGVIHPDQQPLTLGEHRNYCEKIQAKKELLVVDQLKEIEKAIFMASKETSEKVERSARETNTRIDAVRDEANKRFTQLGQDLKEVDKKVGATREEVAEIRGKAKRAR